MGYRSDVSAAFYVNTRFKEDWPTLKLFVDENFPEALKESLRLVEGRYHVGYLFEEQHVKWYDSYPEVVAFTKFVDAYTTLADGEGGPSWAYDFIRIGEDYEDIETVYSAGSDNVLSVVRSIEVDM